MHWLLAILFTSAAFAQDVEIRFGSSENLNRRYETLGQDLCPSLLKNPDYLKGVIFCHPGLYRQSNAQIEIQVSEKDGKPVVTSTKDGMEIGHWAVHSTEKAEQDVIIKNLISRHLVVLNNQRLLEEYVLYNLSKVSKSIQLNQQLQYVDKSSGKVLNFEEAKATFEKEDKVKKHYFRAALDIAVILGIGSAQYWSDKEFNRPDWEYGFDWKSYRQKLITGEAVKFDSNNFTTNAINHPMISGTLYYTAARGNNLSPVEAFLYAFTGSLLWEYVGEFKEKVSINDQIVTPLGGALIGETMHRLAEFLWSSKNSWVHKVFATVADPVGALNRWINKSYPRNSKELDKYGFNKNIFHEFQLRVGVQPTEGVISLNANSSLLNIKDHNEVGSRSGFIKIGEMTKIQLRGLLGNEGMEEFNLLNQAAIGAWYKERIDTDKLKRKKGFSVLVGIASGYEYGSKEYGKKFGDHIGLVNILGGHVELHAFIRGFHIQVINDVSADFTQINSIAVSKLEASGYNMDQTKTVLQQKKYYFAYGATVRSRARIEYKRVSLEADYDYHKAWSVEGLDRYQERITDDFSLEDSRHSLDVRLSYRFFSDFRVGLGYRAQFLFGRAKDQKESLRDDQVYFSVEKRF